MATSAIPLPHFSGKTSLSLQDLDTLAERVQASSATSEYVPASPHKGRKQYTRASFNAPVSAEDACSGTVTLPDKVGLIASVGYAPTEEPYISAGNIVLPLAHDFSPEDSSLPDKSVTGGVTSINVVEELKRAQINRGNIQLPLAQSSWAQTAEGAMYTPGLVYGVQYDPVDDACEGAVLPRIDQGIIHLPAGGGGGGDDTPTTGCSCVPAQFYDDVCTMGEICAVVYDEGISDPVIVDGTIRLPAIVDACPGTVASPLAGVINTAGTPVPWADMVEAPVRLCTIFDYETGIILYLTGQFKNGYLQFSTELR